MTSFNSNDSNAVEGNGIHIEIGNPNPRVFPSRVYTIPKNQLGVNTPVKLTMRIVNKTSTSFRLNPHQPFIPELLASDGQTRPRLLVTDEPITSIQLNRPQQRSETREFDWWKIIKPELPTIIFITARLSWQNNLLQLKIPTIPDRILSPQRPNNYWCFDALQPGTYQLRFILNPDREETTPVLPSDIEEVRTTQETGPGLLVTPYVNLRLAQPLSTMSSAIEVDGVQFKTEMPETVLTIPPRLPGSKTPIKLGIRATNNTLTTLRFEQLGSLDLNLITPNGKEIEPSSDLMRSWVGKGPKYYLAQPGESAFFVLDGTLSWPFERLLQLALPTLQLAIPNRAGSFYYFRDLQPGTYQLQLIYHAVELRASNLNEQVLEKVWIGWIAMPFVEFRLVEP